MNSEKREDTRIIQGICFEQDVAIVGNAQSLLDRNLGDEIDSHDIVVRLNKGVTIEKNGHKCDIHCASGREGIVDPQDFKTEIPQISFWMTPKYREMAPSHFYLFPEMSWRNLKMRALPGGADRPTTGLMAIYMILQTGAANINLYGFDFWQTKTFYLDRRGSRPAHNPAKERDFVDELIRGDSRLRLI